MTNIDENTKEGVTIAYLPTQKKWGIQFNEDRATFHEDWEAVVKRLKTYKKKHG